MKISNEEEESHFSHHPEFEVIQELDKVAVETRCSKMLMVVMLVIGLYIECFTREAEKETGPFYPLKFFPKY